MGLAIFEFVVIDQGCVLVLWINQSPLLPEKHELTLGHIIFQLLPLSEQIGKQPRSNQAMPQFKKSEVLIRYLGAPLLQGWSMAPAMSDELELRGVRVSNNLHEGARKKVRRLDGMPLCSLSTEYIHLGQPDTNSSSDPTFLQECRKYS